MHEFPRYRAPSDEHVRDLVRTHPFALIVSGGGTGGAPLATHAPVVLDTYPTEGDLVGATLLGHVARANPHWQRLDPEVPTLLVFSGPHGYVSPTAYDDDPNVPTWDYAAVHLTTTVEVLEGREDGMHVVTRTVEALEALEPTAWDMTTSIPTFERIVDGIVAFRFRVLEQHAVFKLSQGKPREVRRRVAAAARARGGSSAEVADLIEQVGGDR